MPGAPPIRVGAVKRPVALDRAALLSALRVALAAMTVFAIGDAVLDNPNIALFGFFGAFALLVFAAFAGPARSRLRAYAGLAAVGFPLLALGTVCSRDPWLAGIAMALVGFAILFAGIVSGYVAASAISALLLFVLPVMIAAPDSQIPDRLAGWAMACAVAIPAALLLWPDRPQGALRRQIAEACRAIASCLELKPGGDAAVAAERAREAVSAAHEARRRFASTPYRPTGATGPTAAVAHLVDDVAWVAPLAVPPEPSPQGARFPSEAEEVKAASRQVLRASASALEGGPERPDLDRLERSRAAVGSAFSRSLAASAGHGEDWLGPAFDQAFRLRFLSYAALQIGAQALRAAGRPAPRVETRRLEPAEREPSADLPRLVALRHLIAGYATPRSVWFRNSLRGALALGTAVLLGQLLDVQHGFWVVLGTLSVLRSNALNTGSTILRALTGTVAGIVIGGTVIFAIGADTAVLWAILPVTILLAAYAPRAISFAVGQAAFTVAVLTLFDLIQPSGWEVGLIRVEDIAIGSAISFGLGLLFWPRGASGVVRDAVSAAYARTSDYLAHNVQAMMRPEDTEELERYAEDAMGSWLRLDDAFRQYLAERSTSRLELDSLGSLVAGATRVLRVAHAELSGSALFRLTPRVTDPAGLESSRLTLEDGTTRLRSWYHALGDSVARAEAPPEPLPAEARTEREVLEWLRATGPEPGSDELSRALAMAWTDKLLDTLRGLQPRLAEAAGRLRAEESPSPASGSD